MNSGSDNKRSGGIGLFGVLQIVFLVLKLTGLIDWSWVWVLSPMWISVGIFLIALLIIVAANIIRREL